MEPVGPLEDLFTQPFFDVKDRLDLLDRLAEFIQGQEMIVSFILSSA